MNKLEFLRLLKRELKKRNIKDIPEIMADYEAHFQEGEAGKTEQEIIEELGPVNLIADEYSRVNQNSGTRVIYKDAPHLNIGLFILLIFFDIVVGIAAVSVIFALFASLVAVCASFVIGGGAYAVASFFIFGAFSIKLAGFFVSLAVISLGVLAGFAVRPSIKGIIFLGKQYFGLHKKVLGGRV